MNKLLLLFISSFVLSFNCFGEERIYLTCEFCSDDQCMELDGSQTLIILPDTNEFLFGPEMRRTISKYTEFGDSITWTKNLGSILQEYRVNRISGEMTEEWTNYIDGEFVSTISYKSKCKKIESLF